MLKKASFTCILFIGLTLLLLTGCNNGDEKTAGSSKGEEDIELTKPGTFPITKEKVTLKVLVPAHPLVEDYKTNVFTKWYEEKTNVHIEWEVIPTQNAEEKLNLILSSDDLPDVIMNSPVTLSQLMIYGSQGMFLPLNDLIEDTGTDVKKFLDERPDVLDSITAPDGNIYSMPYINECYHCTLAQKLWIYQPWLEELGLEMPETTEEFYQVLKAFKEKDPNGNGKQDEIPLAGNKDLWPFPGFLMDPFIYNAMYVENGKIQVPYTKPEWKEGLQYIHQLYKEGLIAKESLTQDQDQLKRLGNSKETILGMAMGYWQGDMMTAGGNSGKWLDYVAVPPLEGPNGNRVAWYQPPVPGRASFIITNQAKHPEVALRWAEGFYDEEVTLRAEAGEMDKDWRWAEDGEIGINGEPAKWVRLDAYGEVQNTHWAQQGPLIRTDEFRLSEMTTDEQPLEALLYEETKGKYEPYKPDEDMVVPPLYFNEEQSAELAEIEATIQNFVDESNARFISGDDDIEKGWESFLQNLEAMNLDRYIEIYQEAYDAKYK
ncbi:putative aldouronate transport system substrate-binding protein [Lederbergia galactosidilyticus]|uniref:ABC transporter substrate-binding protein n=1 Tax=Lederbergia galactosidilytica TaxID=217031 RepID=UPI001DC7CA6A|nr:ABC transporter substrate-binding protein [Lederbergia galactosidilytica]MBP1916235.1 putative aldouronate transport system substrate-binding protein [Lederbergia galactosidilytica]